ncbi:variable surface lipoprotein [Pseudochryseolinea flava]|uniref:Calx-beta domain-containing protein n=1 Tax=Pseudochryseolinea flava TaxID=2059302 RepID=A0A364Y6E9_9BACT|nr:variable surface lipoprotein [Pseudochryseolinea flava]RAW01387.1 hypothetical protein DQQ10_10825 [Pseudochryseolinea flava]
MKKNLLVMGSAAILAAMPLVMASCGKDDDDPPSKAAISFEMSETTVYEDEGTIEYTIVLDKPAPEDFVLEFDITGTATNLTDVNPEQEPYDFEVVGDESEIEIAEGETEAKISIKFWSDWILEEDAETIVIKLDDVNSENNLITISGDDELTINLVNEDGTLVGLEWVDVDDDGKNEPVDMDLIFWAKNDESELTPIDAPPFSAPYKDNAFEYVFYPDILEFEDNDYAFSYTYYKGEVDSLLFGVYSVRFENGDYNESNNLMEASGIYETVNKNPWADSEEPTFVIAQNFEIESNIFTNFTPEDTIIAAAESSRVRAKSFSKETTLKFPATLMQNLPKERQKISDAARAKFRSKLKLQ